MPEPASAPPAERVAPRGRPERRPEPPAPRAEPASPAAPSGPRRAPSPVPSRHRPAASSAAADARRGASARTRTPPRSAGASYRVRRPCGIFRGHDLGVPAGVAAGRAAAGGGDVPLRAGASSAAPFSASSSRTRATCRRSRSLEDFEPNIITQVYSADGELLGDFAIEKRVVVVVPGHPARRCATRSWRWRTRTSGSTSASTSGACPARPSATCARDGAARASPR